MGRGRKLLMAGLVLLVGFGLAWPFRKTTADRTLEPPVVAPDVVTSYPPAVPGEQLAAQPNSPAETWSRQIRMPSPAPHVVAKMTSLGDAGAAGTLALPAASFDLAHHPALAGAAGPATSSPVTPPVPPRRQAPLQGYLPAEMRQDLATARPAYATADRDEVAYARQQRPPEVRHVVQNSDTLEKLAKRYLGDEGRALEIFDLNRDLLDNPHLLPIDAELRIPARTAAMTPNSLD